MQTRDPALDRMSIIIQSLTGIMKRGRMPAVDLIDERVVFADAGLARVGIGEASGPDAVCLAMMRALADFARSEDQ